MTIEEELSEVNPEKETALTIGVFDGVHLGHKHLISRLKEEAKKKNLLSGVITFRQHPVEILSPGATLPYLTNIDEKIYLIKKEGVDFVVAISFTKELAELPALKFVEVLKDNLRMRALVIGPDFALGKNREGNPVTLQKLGHEIGFSVTIVPPLRIDGEVVSSTAIRQSMAEGNIKKAVQFMGHPFSLQGKVTTGFRRGTEMGFPTANLEIASKKAIPADGVYVTLSHINGKVYQSLTNIGSCPTFDGNERSIETYIIGYNNNLYGRELRIEIVERLREEKKFNSIEELKKQIEEDIKRGKAILESRGKDEQ